jgi:MFS transporter, SP family, arabinose:H+ symporter
MLHERYADTRKAFGQLGMETTEEEIRAAAEQLRGTVEERRRKSQWTKGVIRALIVVCVFFIFQQITGINVPFYYGPKSGHDPVAAAVAGVEVTAILGAVNVIATYFAFRWIDKFGRRPLAMGGYAGMAVFMLVAAAGVAFFTDIPKTVVVMVGFSFFITSFAIGVGGTGWLIQGEVFPTSVRGRAAAIGAAVDWVANFALIEAFPAWQNAWGLAAVMVSFAVLSVVAIGLVFKFLPETKGRSVEEVVQIFEKQAEGSMAPVRPGSLPGNGRRAPPGLARTGDS